MSTNYHTPIVAGESNAPSTINTRLGGLDAALSGLTTTVAGAAGAGVFTLANGATATTALTVDSTTGFVVGADILYYHTSGTVREFNTVSAIPGATTITLGTAPGGTIADNTVIAQVVKAVLYMGDVLYNVKDFGAVGDGTTDDRAAINTAITACNAAGGGTVYLPPGTYRFTAGAHPNGAVTITCGIVMRSNVWLVGAGIGATTLKLADNQNIDDSTAIFTHYYYGGTVQASGGTDRRMGMRDFTLDGNATNQGSGTKLRDRGIQFFRATHIWHERVEVKDVYGEGAGTVPPAVTSSEGFNFTASACQYMWYTDCLSDGGGGGETSTMYGLSSCTNVHYSNCKAINGKNGNGFANNNSGHVHYDHCQASGNKVHGFNLEFSRFVQYTGCVGGGIPAMENATDWLGTDITSIVWTTVTTVTAAAHGLAVNDYVYIGGNVNKVADTSIVGMVEIADNIYKIGTVPTADTVTLLTTAGANLDSSSYGAYVSGGVICKIAGNVATGFRNQGGRDIVYDGCVSIANGFTADGTNSQHGFVIQGPIRRVAVVGGNYSYNRSAGIHHSGATTGEIRFQGTPFVAKNYGTAYAPSLRGIGSSTTLAATAAAAAVSISVTNSELDLKLEDANYVEIELDNGDTHIALLSGKAIVGGGPGHTFTIAPALPTVASADKSVWLNRRPSMTLPATVQLALPATTPTTAVVYVNQYPFPVMVSITGGTNVSVFINGTDTTLGSELVYSVPAGGTIDVQHTAAPAWRWFQAG